MTAETTMTAALEVADKNAPFTTAQIPLRALGEKDVLIDIAWAGICHSDIHQARDEWGGAMFPMTPGHEIAGTVAAIGPAVTKHQVGDRVGIGCMVDSCGACAMCKDGQEQFCEQGATFTYNSEGADGLPTRGGYAQQIVATEGFVCGIPEGIDLAEAAPLLCAGITTYAPLKRWGAGPGKHVGVIGVGGLGHMAVKIAAAMGAQVSTLSRSDAKAADAIDLGASKHIATSDAAAMKEARGSFDIIINTVSADLDMEAYLKLLRPFGALVNLGLPPGDYQLEPGAVVRGSKVLAGSMIGGIADTQEMLNFCAAHGIGATIEKISASEVDRAYDEVVAGKPRYRCVIDTSTIGA